MRPAQRSTMCHNDEKVIVVVVVFVFKVSVIHRMGVLTLTLCTHYFYCMVWAQSKIIVIITSQSY